MTIGQRGLYANVGAPGTGLSMRRKIDLSGGGGGQGRQVSGDAIAFRLQIAEDGKASFTDGMGNPLPASAIRRIREACAPEISDYLDRAVSTINADLDACLGIHLSTPPPGFRPVPPPARPGSQPSAPAPREVTFWDRLLLRRARIEEENVRLEREHEARLADWREQIRRHEAEAARVMALNDGLIKGRQGAMEEALSERLQQIVWAKETQVAFDFGDDSRTLSLDIDLPTLDEMPQHVAALPARGINLRLSKRSEAQRRRDFVRLVAGTCFRVAGEALACLPTVEEVTVSGFTQRIDQARGGEIDVYLISVRIRRDAWQEISFNALDQIEPEQALALFDLRWKHSRSAELGEIEPH